MIKNYYPQGTYSYRISAYLYPSQASEGQIVSSGEKLSLPAHSILIYPADKPISLYEDSNDI